jgi:hypothetical protein
MKKVILISLTAFSLIQFSCKENKQSISLADYHAITDTGIQTGGLKVLCRKRELKLLSTTN